MSMRQLQYLWMIHPMDTLPPGQHVADSKAVICSKQVNHKSSTHVDGLTDVNDNMLIDGI